jgi:hypothetical protein
MTLKPEDQIYPTGRHPVSLTIGDFNRDLFFDLVITNYEDDTFSVMLGNGDGTFQIQQIYFTGNGSHPYGVVAADLNNDKLLDLGKSLKINHDPSEESMGLRLKP